jgi:heterodisulfide reductase subunit A
VQVHLGCTVETISGFVGSFHARLSNAEELDAGAIVVATGSIPFSPPGFAAGDHFQVITNLDLEQRLKTDIIGAERITFIACVGSRQGKMGCSRYCCTSMLGMPRACARWVRR